MPPDSPSPDAAQALADAHGAATLAAALLLRLRADGRAEVAAALAALGVHDGALGPVDPDPHRGGP